MEHDNLWAPWRIDYIRRIEKADADSACFLCDAWAHPQQDEERLVIWRGEHGLILLNRYPYTNGHLMIAPADHHAELNELTVEQRAALMEMTALAERLLKATLNPQGINVGINLGRSAGAGLPGHVHIHVVPRWSGDTNFMHVVGKVRVIPQSIEQIMAEFKTALPKVL